MGCNITFKSTPKYISDVTTLSTSYFPLVHKSLSLTMTSQKEMKTSLMHIYAKKNYVQKGTEHFKYKTHHKKQKTIYWKKYILSVLDRKRLKGVNWAGALFTKVKDNVFIYEKIFISEAIYQEYLMNFEPKCLTSFHHKPKDEMIDPSFLTTQIHNNKANTENNTILEENNEETIPITSQLLGNSSLADCDNNNNNNIISSSIAGNNHNNNNVHNDNEYVTTTKNKKEHLIMRDPIIDSRSTSLLSVDTIESNNELKEAYLNIIHIIRDHMTNEEHPIHIVINMFREVIVNEMNETPMHEYENEETRMNKLKNMIKEMQSFLIHLQITLKLFYFKAFNFACFKEEKDDVLNLITTLLFSDKQFYKYVFDYYKKAHYKLLNDLRVKLSFLGTITLHETGTDEKFCLDNKTVKAMIKFVESNESDVDKRNELKMKLQKKIKSTTRGRSISTHRTNVDNSAMRVNKIENHLLQFTNTDDEYEDDDDDDNNNNNNNAHLNFANNNYIPDDLPYKKPLHMLRELSSIRSPYQKMIQLVKIGKEIRTEVHSFWMDIPKYLIRKEALGINTDNFLSIFNYLIAMNNDPNLYIHYKLIDDFTGEYSKNSNVGYYQAILEGGLKFIMTVDKKEKMRDNAKKRTMITKQSMLFRSYLI